MGSIAGAGAGAGAVALAVAVAVAVTLLLAGCPPAAVDDDDDTPAPAGVCGDGDVDEGEDCDDGNVDDLDDCAVDCTPAAPFHDFDRVFLQLMEDWDLPGGAVAVTVDGRLVLRRGYGLADVEADELTHWSNRFRIASVSKPITAAVVLALVEDDLLSLDEPAFAMLPDLQPLESATEDPRLADVTVRDLLQHSGGWDRTVSPDPMFQSQQIASDMGVPSPPDADTIVRWMRGQPLDFTPGTAWQYSNFGYAVLGRIVERVTGDSYFDAAYDALLSDAGVENMALGGSLLSDRLPGEVRYYPYPGEPLVASVFEGEDGLVPAEYGGYAIEAMDSHGGWIASAPDLARFVGAVDGTPGYPDVLSQESINQMIARPSLDHWAGEAAWYAFGWLVRPTLGDANWWHGGSLPGTTTQIVRMNDGVVMVALFNARDANIQVGGALDQALWSAKAAVESWPDYDLFER